MIQSPSTCSADLHRAERDLVVRSDDRDLIRALDLLHRALRHEERAAHGLRGGSDLGVQAGPEHGVGVREQRLHQDRPGLRSISRLATWNRPGRGYVLPSARMS